jgi:hypothetical protein
MISVETKQVKKAFKNWDIASIAELVFTKIDESVSGEQHFAVIGDGELLFAVVETSDAVISISDDENMVVTDCTRGIKYPLVEALVIQHVGGSEFNAVTIVECDIDIKITF